MSRFFLSLPLWMPLFLFSQKVEHDWENYIVPLNGKPVSINVDLGLKSLAPVKEDSMVIIMRVKLNQLDQQGMPKQEDFENLLNIEDRLVEYLARQCGAIFAGRFTQRGIREFYFYAPDSLGYRKALNQAMQPYGSYEWLAQAKMDRSWSNYFEVLYPSDLDFLRIQSKRKLARLVVRKGEKINISHFLSFSDVVSMNRFLSGPDAHGFSIDKLPAAISAQTGKFELLLSRPENPETGWIERVIIPLYKKVSEYGGIYKGWEGNIP